MSDVSADPLLDAALKYAERGLYVFPVRLGVRGEGKKDVRPIDNWNEVSSRDPEQITKWWTNGWAGAALAIDTGRSGLVVADQDVSDGKRGPENWEILGERSEFRVRTPSGGLHDYYREDPMTPVTVANRGEVADGVDVRGIGGFVFAPPTVDPRGGRWEWELGDIPDDFTQMDVVPSVIPERVNAARASLRPKVDASVTHVTHPSSQLFAQPSGNFGPDGGWKTKEAAAQLLDKELEAFLALTSEGSARSHVLSQRLGVLAGHGIPAFWDYDTALSILMDACERNGFTAAHGEKYVEGQAIRGLDYGMTQPWHMRLAFSESESPAPATGRLRRAMYNRSALRELPPLEPIIEDVLHARSISVISGKFGTYKTFVTVGMACSLATGEPWFGHRVPEAMPVIYAAAEGAYGINGRIDAWEDATGRTVPDTLYVISVAARINRPYDMTELEELIQETGAKVVIFDTLHASTPGVDEKDAGPMGEVVDVLRTLRDRHGVSVILPHHTGHAGERSRGSSAIEDDADASFVIKLGGDGEDRRPENPRTLYHRKAKDSALLEPVTLVLEERKGSAYVRPQNAFEAAQGSEEGPTGDGWMAPEESVPQLVEKVLTEAGHARGLTKSETHAIVVERWYGGQKKRLKNGTWHSGWNRALERESIVQVGGERFSADPLVIEALSD
jgi:hypothetical protein